MNALVLLSGGQDSTTSLFWAKERFSECEALIINYLQRHKIEVDSAIKIANMADVPHQVFSTDILKKLGKSALVEKGDINSEHELNPNLPASFVPGRNLLFLLIAGIIAYQRKIPNIVIGTCQTDYSGYPDCRQATITYMTETLNKGLDYPLEIHTPVMFMTKRQEVELAQKLPGCMDALAFSHTCYEGKFPPCGECPACKLRAKGFYEAGIPDPLIERAKNG